MHKNVLPLTQIQWRLGCNVIGDQDTYDPRQHYAFSSDNTTNNIKQLIICLPDSTTSCTKKVANYTKAIKDVFTQAACVKKD